MGRKGGGWRKEGGRVRFGGEWYLPSVPALGWGRKTSLRRVFEGLSVEEEVPIFGWTIGWGEHLYACNFLASLTWLKIKRLQWGRWRVEGGRLVEELGSGGDVCGLGTRSLSRSVRRCYLILFCRILLLTGGGGFMILLLVTLSEGLISISRGWLLLWSILYLKRCGWSKFRWRFQCLFGGFSATDFPQKTIWRVGESSM